MPGHDKRGFCQHCGSPINWLLLNSEQEWSINLDVGSLDNPEDVRPSMHIYIDRKLPWYKIDDDLRRIRSDEMNEVVTVGKKNA